MIGNYYLTIMAGPTIAVPIPPQLSDMVESVEVTHSDSALSGFSMTIASGRNGPLNVIDSPQLSLGLLLPGNRIVLTVTVNGIPEVLFDGIISDMQYQPSDKPGKSKVVITGEDLSIMMDREENTQEYPAQPVIAILMTILAKYSMYGVIPSVIPTPSIEVPLPTERTPVISGMTDLQVLQAYAKIFGYVFYIIPGPVPLSSTAFWGPPIMNFVPQRAINTNMGPFTNVRSLTFQNKGSLPTLYKGDVQEKDMNQQLPVMTFLSTRPPLGVMNPLIVNKMFAATKVIKESGISYTEAMAIAQGKTDDSMNDVVTGNGTMDTVAYGKILKARMLAQVRGAGYNYDGFYMVKSVNHNIKRGEYTQSFQLSREALGSTIPAVLPL